MYRSHLHWLLYKTSFIYSNISIIHFNCISKKTYIFVAYFLPISVMAQAESRFFIPK